MINLENLQRSSKITTCLIGLAIALGLTIVSGCRPPLRPSQVTYHGGAEGVSGTLAFIEHERAMVLLDCGGFYPEAGGNPEERRANAVASNAKLPEGARKADSLVVTHAHADHIARIPLLVRMGFKGPIYATEPTIKLSEEMLRMVVRWDESEIRNWKWSAQREGKTAFHWVRDCEWAGKISPSNRRTFLGTRTQLERHLLPENDAAERPEINPCKICTESVVKELMRRFKPLSYESPTLIAHGIRALAYSASHIPGAASIMMELTRSDGSTSRVLFSGDVGNDASALLDAPVVPPAANLVFMEATYGTKKRAAEYESERARFRHDVKKALDSGRLVWIPAFALDRTQKILHELKLLNLPKQIPIHLSSPSAQRFTEIYKQHLTAGWFRKELMPDPFAQTLGLDQVAGLSGPAVLITTSGMMNAAASKEMIPSLVNRDDVTIFFVGYQDPDSEGAAIRDGKNLSVNGRPIELKASRLSYSCYSGHGRVEDMDRWLSRQAYDTKIGLVHGSNDELNQRQIDLVAKNYSGTFVTKIAHPIPIPFSP